MASPLKEHFLRDRRRRRRALMGLSGDCLLWERERVCHRLPTESPGLCLSQPCSIPGGPAEGSILNTSPPPRQQLLLETGERCACTAIMCNATERWQRGDAAGELAVSKWAAAITGPSQQSAETIRPIAGFQQPVDAARRKSSPASERRSSCARFKTVNDSLCRRPGKGSTLNTRCTNKAYVRGRAGTRALRCEAPHRHTCSAILIEQMICQFVMFIFRGVLASMPCSAQPPQNTSRSDVCGLPVTIYASLHCHGNWGGRMQVVCWELGEVMVGWLIAAADGSLEPLPLLPD
ncbi:unnamed protein product [Pleuronectes platessa]|uniref:Uncharacterized protein n=1 Tax=Pleuronectes platessa TaxID=8262 RepID=A0A9N7YCN8_PLEPL|nr:unnamed protein product [Pleuronectes platessa]